MKYPCEPLPEDWFTTSAPVCLVFDVDLACTPDQLFTIFEDEHSWPKWASPGINRVEWTSPRPFGVGTTRTVFLSSALAVYEEFTLWERGVTMSFFFVGTSQKIWRRFGELYEVHPTDAGCHLRWTVAYDPLSWFGMLHPFVKPIMRFGLGSYLKNLKKYVEKTL